MDLLSRIASWLGANEATIGAVVGITVLAGLLFVGLRLLLRRRGEASAEKPPASGAEASGATGSSSTDLDPLTVPGFEGRPAVAVLSFDDLSGDPEQEYFADGLAEDLITRLSAWRDFPVIARNSSFTYKGSPVDVKQVSRELGVRYVVQGSVRKAGERLRISAQLIDATMGVHVWVAMYDRELRGIFELQDEITQAIVASMYPEIERSEMRRVARKEPQRLDAWDCVMRGWWHRSQFTKEDNIAARTFFKRAIELDPQCAEAFAGLAYLHASAITQGWATATPRSVANLTRFARRSVELDPSNPSAQLALSVAARFTGRTQEWITGAQQALELNPSDWRGYQALSLAFAQTGATAEALEYVERGMRLSPRDPMIWMFLQNASAAHFGAKRYGEAVEWARRLVQAAPKVVTNWRLLATACAHSGRLDEARSAFQEISRLQPAYAMDNTRVALAAADPDFRDRYIEGLRKAGLDE